jgi:CMP-N-acetylneuraminic acid synthetase
MTLTALIPLRGGSKGIPKKNLQILSGKPLYSWVLDAALLSSSVKSIIVSSDSDEIIQSVRDRYPQVTLHIRASDISRDSSPTEQTIEAICDLVTSEHICLLQATSPFTTYQDIDNAYNQLIQHEFDSLLSVVKHSKFFWQMNSDGSLRPINYDYTSRPMRQSHTNYLYQENGAIYIFSRAGFLASSCRLHGRIGAYLMDSYASTEIDSPDDLAAASARMKKLSST